MILIYVWIFIIVHILIIILLSYFLNIYCSLTRIHWLISLKYILFYLKKKHSPYRLLNWFLINYISLHIFIELIKMARKILKIK